MQLSRLAIALIVAVAAGCSSPQLNAPPRSPSSHGKPLRIVSLDYCADQFVIKLADTATIVAVSHDADRDFSYMRQQAVSLPAVRPDGEAILALKPDLVVRSYGGGPGTTAFLEKAGVKVHQIGWGEDFDAVRNNVRQAAKAMGQSAKGDQVIAEFDARLARLRPANGTSTLYMTRGGVTTGPGSLIDLMMTTAGLTNFQVQKGWNPLPLESLTILRPDMVATAFIGPNIDYQDYWSSARHPIARALLQDVPVARLDGATTTCGGWFIMDAIEVLADQGRKVTRRPESGTRLQP